VSEEGRSILLVDDDDSLRRVLELELQAAGHKVSARPSAEEALSALDEASFDLIISDIRMPGMDGLELLG